MNSDVKSASGIDPASGEALRLSWKGSRITGVERIEYSESLPWIYRPFFDMELNGFIGVDYSGDFDTSDLEKVVRALGKQGTGYHLPTIVTSPQDRIIRNLQIIAASREESEIVGACVPGVHIEGPYISEIDGPRGAHDPRYIRNPSINEVKEWIEASSGLLKVITLAPERPGAIELIDFLAAQGIRTSIGHTAASRMCIREAVTHGVSLSTHLGNGSHASLPRLENYIWYQLGERRLGASLICDGYHLPDDVLYTLYKTKGRQKSIIVSDAAPMAGLKPGTYHWGNIEVELHEGGPIRLAGTRFLSGAATLLDSALMNFMRVTEAPLSEALELVTVNPARFVGIHWEPLTAGSEASFMTFRLGQNNRRFLVSQAVTGGHIILEENTAQP